MSDPLTTEQRLTMGNNAAFPTLDSTPEGGLQLREWGLTRRELFAAMAMQGLLANPQIAIAAKGDDIGPFITRASIASAEDLLAALEKPRE